MDLPRRSYSSTLVCKFGFSSGHLCTNLPSRLKNASRRIFLLLSRSKTSKYLAFSSSHVLNLFSHPDSASEPCHQSSPRLSCLFVSQRPLRCCVHTKSLTDVSSCFEDFSSSG